MLPWVFGEAVAMVVRVVLDANRVRGNVFFSASRWGIGPYIRRCGKQPRTGMPHKGSGKKSRARSPPLPPDVDTYVIGSTWSDAEREHLAVFFAAINAAAEPKRYACMKSVEEYGLEIRPSDTGDGVFSPKDVPQYTCVGLYRGVVEKASKFKDDGYSIGLPPITFPDGTVVRAVLSGYGQRLVPGSASMFNHACLKFNARFLYEDLYVKKNIEAGWKVQRLMEKKSSVIPDALLAEAAEVLFTFPVVIVMTDKDVAAGTELRVTYNRQPAASGAYFTTRRNACKSAGKGYCVAKCMCEPGGCPLRRYYVTKRAPAGQPAP